MDATKANRVTMELNQKKGKYMQSKLAPQDWLALHDSSCSSRSSSLLIHSTAPGSDGLPFLSLRQPQRGEPMRRIPLPEPELEPPGGATPEIFAAGGGATVVRRAVVIGNGCAGAENQCLGLLRALGLSDRFTLYRAIRPTGGINKLLHFLPISLHKLVDQFLGRVFSDTRFATVDQVNKSAQYSAHNRQSFGLSSILEADTQKIVTMVHGTFEKEGPALVVACGRDTIPYASSIRRLAPDNVFVIQIQHPRYRLGRFDLVVTPRHDYYALTTKGQQEVPRLFRRWITPQEPPGPNVETVNMM